MPWSIEDVEAHNKGLSDKQKERWVSTANSILKKLMKEGKSEEDAAASAIRQANGVVKNELQTHHYINTQKEENYKVTKKKHEGKEYMVVPVTMMVEGVHNGSHGPLLHLMEDLGKFPESWNGIPVVVDHPEKDGQAISANSPEVLEEFSVGQVFNTRVDGEKLRADAWIDPERLDKVCGDVLVALKELQPIEISVGVFTEDEDTEGVYKDESYTAIARNHRPDHLALLPNAVGACSLADGCGIRANKEGKVDIKNLIKDIKVLQSLNKEGYVISPIGNNREQGYQELMNMIYTKLRTLDKPQTNEYTYLEECYEDSLIYNRNTKEGNKMYKQPYKVESGKVEFVGEPIEVHKKVEYIVNALQRTKFNTNKKEGNMPKNECPECIEKVNQILANKELGYAEADREWLSTLPKEALERVAKVKEVEKTIEVNKLSPEDQADLAFAKKQRQEKRAAMTKTIQDNTSKEIWPDEVLNKLSEDHLERVFNSVKKEEEVVNYSLAGANAFVANASDEEPLYPIGQEIETKK